MKYIFTILILLFAGQGWATTYYVTTTGSGTDCTEGSPCAYNYAINTKATAGDTVSVDEGNYTTSDAVGGVNINFYINNTGTLGNILTIKSKTKWGAKIICPFKTSTYYGVRLGTNSSYVSIEDFEISDCYYGVNSGDNASGNTNITWKGNKIHDNIQGMGSCTNCDYVTFDGNLIYNFGLAGSNQYHGIYAGGRNNTLINNIVWGKTGNGWHLHGGTTGTPKPSGIWNISNNTLHGSPSGGTTSYIRLYGDLSQLDAVNVTNNIAYAISSATNLFYIGSNITDATYTIKNNIHYNITFPCGDNTSAHCVAAIIANNSISDPLLTSPTTDFTLANGSPALNSGLATNAPDADFIGTSRPQGSADDIGAYEHDATYQCSDGIDNDADGLIDSPDDTGCTGTTDNTEINSIAPPNLAISDNLRLAIFVTKIYTLYYDLHQATGYTPTVDFYYKTSYSSDCTGGTLIATCDNLPTGDNATCLWDTTGLDGKYYIYGIASDTENGTECTTLNGTTPINVFECVGASGKLCVEVLRITP